MQARELQLLLISAFIPSKGGGEAPGLPGCDPALLGWDRERTSEAVRPAVSYSAHAAQPNGESKPSSAHLFLDLCVQLFLNWWSPYHQRASGLAEVSGCRAAQSRPSSGWDCNARALAVPPPTRLKFSVPNLRGEVRSKATSTENSRVRC
jgi:hypothetical protein